MFSLVTLLTLVLHLNKIFVILTTNECYIFHWKCEVLNKNYISTSEYDGYVLALGGEWLDDKPVTWKISWGGAARGRRAEGINRQVKIAWFYLDFKLQVFFWVTISRLPHQFKLNLKLRILWTPLHHKHLSTLSQFLKTGGTHHTKHSIEMLTMEWITAFN